MLKQKNISNTAKAKSLLSLLCTDIAKTCQNALEIIGLTPLYVKYIDFKALLLKNSATIIQEQSTPLYQKALHLHSIGKNRDPLQEKTYRQLLQDLYTLTGDRQAYVLTAARGQKTERTLSPFEHKLTEQLQRSKKLFNTLDRNQKDLTLAIIIPIHKENVRLSSPLENLAGENFIENKLAQLEFLLEGTQHTKIHLVFAENEIQTNNPRTTDLIKQKLLTYKHSKIYAHYCDAGPINASSEAKKERAGKGYAVRCGLSYARTHIPSAQHLLYTDADLSANLGLIGLLLNTAQQKQAALVTASRRIKGSVIVGRNAQRLQQSTIFNLLTKLILNITSSDTQTGLKLLSADLYDQIASNLTDNAMSFDTQIIALAKETQATIAEQPIAWQESPLESQSEGAAVIFSMIDGILKQRETLYPSSFKETPNHLEILNWLNQQPEAQAIIQLSQDQLWQKTILLIPKIYDLLPATSFKLFIVDLKILLHRLAQNEPVLADLETLIKHLTALESDILDQLAPLYQFTKKLFPALNEIHRLILKEPAAAKLIIMMLFGQNVLTNFLSPLDFPTLAEWLAKKMSRTNTFTEWYASFQGNKRKLIRKDIAVAEIIKTETPFIERAWEAGAALNQKLQHENKDITTTIVITIDRDWNETNIQTLYEKITGIQECALKYPHLRYQLTIVNTKKSNVETHVIQQRLAHEALPISFTTYDLTQEAHKGNVIRHGLSASANHKTDYLLYVDFSNKINIRESLLLISAAANQDNPDSITLGSRRASDAEIINKPLTFIARSAILNSLIRGMFPTLCHLSDTQAGMKLISQTAWQKISKQNPHIAKEGFDVELLHLAGRQGACIQEIGVSFIDTFGNAAEIDSDASESIFDDILAIRKEYPDLINSATDVHMLGAGAEHLVFTNQNTNYVIKVPHAAFDYKYFGFLQALIENIARPRGLFAKVQKDSDQGQLINNPFLSKLFKSKSISSLLVKLRSWPELNAQIMGAISAIEAKDFKGTGYLGAQKYGTGLIANFNQLTNAQFSYNQKPYTFTHDDKVYISEKSQGTVQKAIIKALTEKNTLKAKQILDDVFTLYRQLWRAGLYDLDTNFLCDIGYFDTALKLLDPGEIQDNKPASVNDLKDQGVFNQAEFKKRWEYTELESLCNTHKTPELITYFEKHVIAFQNYVAKNFESFGENRPLIKPMPLIQKTIILHNAQPHYRPHDLINLSADDQLSYHHTKEKLSITQGYAALQNTTIIRRWPEHFTPTLGANILNWDAAPQLANAYIPQVLPQVIQLNQEQTHSQVIVHDAGKSRRMGLFSIAAGSKGNIYVHNASLIDRALNAVPAINHILEALKDKNLTACLSSDTWFELSSETQASIIQYFQDDHAPGVYFFDLPNAGKAYQPLSLKTMQDYLAKDQNTALWEDLFSEFLFTRGIMTTQKAELKNMLINAIEQIQKQKTKKHKGSKQTTPKLPLDTGIIKDIYIAWLNYNSYKNNNNGMKPPYFFIFEQGFLKEYSELLSQYPELFLVNEMDLYNFVIKPIKSDEFYWMLDKPGYISSKRWKDFFFDFKKLQTKFNISTDNIEQNEARTFKDRWDLVEDGYDIVRLLKEDPRTTHQNNIIHLDQGSTLNPQIKTIPLVAIKSKLHGALKISNNNDQTETIFYDITLHAEESLSIIPGHLYVTIDNKLISAPFRSTTKATLQKEKIYIHNKKDGSYTRSTMTIEELRTQQINQLLQEP